MDKKKIACKVASSSQATMGKLWGWKGIGPTECFVDHQNNILMLFNTAEQIFHL